MKITNWTEHMPSWAEVYLNKKEQKMIERDMDKIHPGQPLPIYTLKKLNTVKKPKRC